MHHYLQGSAELDPEALHERLVGQQQESSSVYFLLAEDSCIVLAVGGILKELHNLSDGPRPDIHRQT